MNFDFCGWNDGYNVGDQTLDAQNKALIDLFGEILNALGDGGRIEATRQRFGKLMDHIREHFAADAETLIGHPHHVEQSQRLCRQPNKAIRTPVRYSDGVPAAFCLSACQQEQAP